MSDMTEMDFVEMAAPSSEHSRFEPFAGTFTAEVKLWMGPGDPHVTTGRMVNTVDLGGRYLRQEYTGDPMEGPFPDFEGRGYWGYNKATGEFEGFWIDTASTMMQTETGSVDASGTVWTMTSESIGPTGQPMKKKSVITLKDDDHHMMEMFWVDPTGAEVKGMEINYQRA